jgi:hypothetical protein
MIRAGQRHVHQGQEGMEEAFRLVEGQVKEQAEGERRLDGDVGIHRRGASPSRLWRCPGIDGVLTDPQGDVAAITQRFVILMPVFHTIRGLVFRMPMGSFVGLCHALHRWLSGLLMSKHDARFSGRQEHRGDLGPVALTLR